MERSDEARREDSLYDRLSQVRQNCRQQDKQIEELKLENKKLKDNMNKHNSDPVRFEDDAWYWWDETWSDRTGPFGTREEADADCAEYCKECLGD